MKNSNENVAVHRIVAFGFAAAMMAFLFFVLKVSHGLPAFGKTYEVKALLPTSGAQLIPGARVTLGGVEVGSVTGIERRGVGALITMRIDDKDGVVPIPSDTHVQLLQRTPLGENYMSLNWGHSKTPLKSGSVLPISQADDSTEVDQILSVLKGKSRERARQLIGKTGAALQGRGDELNDLLDGASGTLYHGGNVVRALAQNRVQLGQITAQLGDIAATIGERGDDIDQVARDSLTTFTAIADRDDRLRQLVEELPGTLDQVRSTSGTLTTVSDQAAPVLNDLASTLHDARPTALALRPAARDLTRLVNTLDVAAPKLTTTLGEVKGLAAPTTGALPQIRQTLCQVDPMLKYLAPYTPDVIDTIVGLNSATNAYDRIGHTIRLAAIVSDNSLVGLPPDVSAAAKQLLHAGLLTQGGSDLNWNPYPKPHSAFPGITGGNSFLGPQSLADGSYFKYPRIRAEC